MGFAEESMREEDSEPEEIEEEATDTSDIKAKGVIIQLLANENPKLFSHVVKKVLEHKKKWAEYRLMRYKESLDNAEVDHELQAIKKSGISEE